MKNDEGTNYDLSGKALADNNPYSSILLDANINVIDCNEEAMRFFGFANKEDFLNGFLPLIQASVPPSQATGRESISISQRFADVVKKGRVECDTMLLIRGKIVVLDVIFKRISYGDSFAIAIYTVERKGMDERERLMLDAAPLVCNFFDESGKVIDCNMEAVRFFGFSSKEKYLEGYLETIPEFQPNGVNSYELLKKTIDKTFITGCAHLDFMYKMPDDSEFLLVEITFVRIICRETPLVCAYARDSRVLEQAKVELQVHYNLLQTMNAVAANLIGASPDIFESAVQGALKLIGQTMNADRAYIWENFEIDGKQFCRQIYEYSETVTPQQGQEFTMSLAYEDVPLWKEYLLNNRTLNSPVKNLPKSEREILEMQNIKSLILIPIYSGGEAWGFIGFDDCKTERVFSEVEEQMLHSGGALIVSALTRNAATQELIRTKNELMWQEQLRRAINKAASLLLESEQEDFDGTIKKALKGLGLSVDAARVAIWQNSKVEEDEGCGVRIESWAEENPLEENIAAKIKYENLLPYWYEGPCDINVPIRALSEKARELFQIRDGASLLIIPINIHGEFWGMLTFVHRSENHVFSVAEKNILRSGGMMMASAIMRNEIMANLVETRERALAGTKAKGEFLSRMSHEIRTPMNAIIGMTLLAKKSDDIGKIRHYLETVDSSSKQLLSIINDVLDMSKIDADKLEIVNREFDFEKMLRHVFNVSQVKIVEKALNFSFDLPRTFSRGVISDELRLSQVLINLLSNAVKFTPNNGSITLKVLETPIDDNRSALRIEVIDNGMGISAGLIPKLFKSFEQGDGGITRQYGGTGLGLSICKRIIDLMGGTIRCESEPGRGTTFIVEIDVEWGGEIVDMTDILSLKQDLRVLVVDDAPDVLEYFRSAFNNFSLACDTAINGYNAIDMIKKSIADGCPYNVIFVDWYMPGMNGGETAHRIKQIVSDNVIIIMISSADWTDIEKDMAKDDIHHFLSKPVLMSEIYNTLVTLSPLAVPAQNADYTEGDGTYNWDSKHILLVEDVEINREIVIGMLEDTGVIIETAENGLEAVEKYEWAPNKYDLILMDVQMPVMDGLRATRSIRASGLPTAKTIPIIAMTANAFKEDEEASFNAGMNGHIAKPFEAGNVFEVLKEFLG